MSNRDYQCGSEEAIIALLRQSGMIVLNGTGVELDLPGGAPVRNVALPVLQRAYAVYCLGEPGFTCAEPREAG